MTQTMHLALPFIEAAQAQKHVTHNEALQLLDAIIQLSVEARDQSGPPVSPAEGQRLLVAPGATGVFAGKDLQIAAFIGGGWTFIAPRAGWRVYVEAEQVLLVYDGAAWLDAGLAIRALQNLGLFGIGTTADAANPFSAKLNAALFAAKSAAEGGTGDLRFTLNKSAFGSTVSQVYQTNWSGRAETGLAGDDHFRVKVSADGSTWKAAIDVDPTTGKYSSPSGRIHAATEKDIADFVFTPGGDGQVSFYRMDRTSRYKNPRTATISSISGDTISLTTADADLFFTSIMANVSFVRIWNVGKTPNQPAWVRAKPGSSQLQVIDAASISSWAAGETIQIGDPTSITANRVIAIDISPMMQNVLGAVFAQKAVLMKIGVTAANSSGSFDASPSGATGSFTGLNMPTDGAFTSGQIMVPCSVPSPVSNSNLVFLRESVIADGTLGVTIASSIAVFA